MTRGCGSVVYHKANVCWGLGGGELGSKLPVLCYASNSFKYNYYALKHMYYGYMMLNYVMEINLCSPTHLFDY